MLFINADHLCPKISEDENNQQQGQRTGTAYPVDRRSMVVDCSRRMENRTADNQYADEEGQDNDQFYQQPPFPQSACA